MLIKNGLPKDQSKEEGDFVITMEFAFKTGEKRSNKKSAKSKISEKTVCSERCYPVQRFGVYAKELDEHLKKGASPIQRMICIGGRNYCNFNDLDADDQFKNAFVSAFANRRCPSSRYLANSKIAQNLDFYLWSDTQYPFEDFQQLFYACLPQVYGYLQYTPAVVYNNMAPVEIRMTGDRDKDFKAANVKLKLAETPKGYTWHHIEGIRVDSDEIKCDMILLESSYHNTIWHVGSVNQYEILRGINYK